MVGFLRCVEEEGIIGNWSLSGCFRPDRAARSVSYLSLKNEAASAINRCDERGSCLPSGFILKLSEMDTSTPPNHEVTIRTPRLLLRPLQLEDTPHMFRLRSNPKVLFWT